MAADRIVSVAEAAELRGVVEESIIKAVRVGRLYARTLSAKGFMLSRNQVTGGKFSKPEFDALCDRYVCVPDACDIMHKTDAAVIRDLKSGVVKGFRLNRRAWAVLKASAEQEYREYLETNSSRCGRKRAVGPSRSPRTLRKKPLKTASRSVQSQRGANR